jgi:hypothetical protein
VDGHLSYSHQSRIATESRAFTCQGEFVGCRFVFVGVCLVVIASNFWLQDQFSNVLFLVVLSMYFDFASHCLSS